MKHLFDIRAQLENTARAMQQLADEITPDGTRSMRPHEIDLVKAAYQPVVQELIWQLNASMFNQRIKSNLAELDELNQFLINL